MHAWHGCDGLLPVLVPLLQAAADCPAAAARRRQTCRVSGAWSGTSVIRSGKCAQLLAVSRGSMSAGSLQTKLWLLPAAMTPQCALAAALWSTFRGRALRRRRHAFFQMGCCSVLRRRALAGLLPPPLVVHHWMQAARTAKLSQPLAPGVQCNRQLLQCSQCGQWPLAAASRMHVLCSCPPRSASKACRLRREQAVGKCSCTRGARA